jgi:hypothetical protein
MAAWYLAAAIHDHRTPLNMAAIEAGFALGVWLYLRRVQVRRELAHQLRHRLSGQSARPRLCQAGGTVASMSDLTASKGPDPVAPSPLYRAMVAGGVDYRPWEKPQFGEDECFLCSAPLTDTTRTLEDVIPKWIQSTLRQRRQQPSILLPNLTQLPPQDHDPCLLLV